MNRQRIVALLAIASFMLAIPAQAVPTEVPSALVVDPCRAYDPANPPPEPFDPRVSETTLIDFARRSPFQPIKEVVFWESMEPYAGGAFATLAGYEQSHIFLVRGKTLEMYDLSDITSESAYFVPAETWDIEALSGLNNLTLGPIAAGKYIGLEAGPEAFFFQATLYLMAMSGSNAAYYIAIDQQWLIEGSASTETFLYDVEQICSGPGICNVTRAIDIVSGDESGPFSEELLLNVVQDFGGGPLGDAQMTYRLERGLAPTDYTLTAVYGSLWADKTDPGAFDPMVEVSSGLAFAPNSSDAYIPHKNEWKVGNLSDFTQSCELSGEPTDIVVWEPGINMNNPRYIVATTWDGTTGRLEVFPAGECPGEPPPPFPTFSIPVGAEPTSVDIYVEDNDDAWLLVSSRVGQLFEAIKLRAHKGVGEDWFSPVETRTIDMIGPTGHEDSCPQHVEFGKHVPLPGGEPGTGLDRNCLPSDPRCRGGL